MKKRVGVDLGNVVIGGGAAQTGETREGDSAAIEDTSFFGDNYLKTPMVTDAFEAVAELSKNFDVWIISKCGLKVQEKSLNWLEHYNFFEITGVQREQVIFCRKRNEKAGIAQSLNLVAFIDDREDIIESMQGVVEQPILFTSWKETKVHPPERFKQ